MCNLKTIRFNRDGQIEEELINTEHIHFFYIIRGGNRCLLHTRGSYAKSEMVMEDTQSLINSGAFIHCMSYDTLDTNDPTLKDIYINPEAINYVRAPKEKNQGIGSEIHVGNEREEYFGKVVCVSPTPLEIKKMIDYKKKNEK